MKKLIYSLIWVSVVYVIITPIYLFFNNNYRDVDLFLLMGSIVGLVLFIVFFWQYALSLKVLNKLLRLDLATVIALHKDLGIYSVILLFIHPLYKQIDSFFNNGSLKLLPSLETRFDQMVVVGEIGLVLVLVTWVLGYLIKKYITFRFWKFTHLATYLVMPIVYVHATQIGSFISHPLIYIFINILFITYIAFVVIRLIDASGIFKAKYKLVNKEVINDVLQLTLEPTKSYSRIKSRMGQFIYTQLTPFGEAHPYSIVWNDNKGGLVLGLKAVGKFSKQLLHAKLNSTIMLDGPYGKFLDGIEKVEHAVFIAGGIGITPFVEFTLNSNNIDSIKKIDFFYATKTLNDSVFVNKQSIKNLPKVNLVNVLSLQTNINEANVEQGFVTHSLINKYNKSMDNCEYYICGPALMMKAVSDDLIKNGIEPSKIHTEEFSW